MAKKVVDVSQHNGAINWPLVAKNVDAAIIRAGYRGYGAAGTLVTDSQFKANITGALSAGLPVGAYWCSQALSEAEARAEADYLAKLLKGYTITYPVYLDSEWMEPNAQGRADRISKARRTQYAMTFLRAVRDYGYKPGLYTGEFWFTDQLDGPAMAKDGVEIWLAKWGSVKPRHDHDAWQYTETAIVPGIAGKADLSHFYVDYAASGEIAEYREAVQKRFGFESHTMDYLQAYKYGKDLLYKLATRG